MTAKRVVPRSSKKRKVNLLSDVPAIGKYLDRIGAEANSPRTARVKAEREKGSHYERADLANVSFQRDGTWEASHPKYLPNDEERAEIEKQVGDYQWPTLWKKPKIARPKLPPEIAKAQKANPLNVFEFCDLDNNVVMYQVRVDLEDGGKIYVPWTYWDDLQWRSMEPDEALPLWGLEQLKFHTTVFLHEGAKAARHARKIASLVATKKEPIVDQLTSDEREKLAQHPWAVALQHAAHLGWIGGALQAKRTDWSPLKKAGVSQVIILADHDEKGEDAVQMISKLLVDWDVQVFSVRFDDNFPSRFDLADEFPKKFFNKDGKYTGPSFRDMLRPATWATAVVEEKEESPKRKGRPRNPSYYLRPGFVRQWKVVKLAAKPVFINVYDRTRIVTTETLNAVASTYSDVRTIAEKLERKLTAEVEAIAYEPGTQEVILTDKNGRRAINTWVPGNVHIAELPPLRLPHPTPPEEYLRRAREQLNEAAQPWLDFLSHLFPIEAEREFVMRWCATLVVRPEIKMNFGLLLISEVQGVGKTTLGMILSVLIGEHNVSWPNENQILENQFNTWRVRKRLVFCNEIYSGHSLRAYNKLKDVISDAYFEAREMYTPSYTLKSYVHVILCSNSIDALRLAEDDRRVYMPKVTDQKWPEKRWVALHTWLVEGGYGVVLLWAREFLKSHDAIGPETHPPMTETKRKTIEGQTDEDQRLARDIAEAALEMAQAKGRERVILLDRMVQEWVAGKLGLRIDTDDPRGRAAWHWSFKKVRKGLTQAGLKLVSQYKQVGTRYEAYGNFGAEEYDPKTFHEEVVAPRDVELWDDQRRPL